MTPELHHLPDSILLSFILACVLLVVHVVYSQVQLSSASSELDGIISGVV